MALTLVSILVFAGVAAAVAGGCALARDLFHWDRDRIVQRVDQEFRLVEKEEERKPSLFKDLGRLAAGLSDLSAYSWKQRLRTILDQAGLDWSSTVLIEILLGTGLIVFALVGWFLGNLWLAGAAGATAAAVPWLYVLARRRRRQQRLLHQFPDALDLMARTLASGHTLSQSLQEVGRQFRPPLGIEFAYASEQHRLGLPLETALEDLAARTGMLEIRVLVMALLVQQQSGGNLTSLLQRLSAFVRERFRIQGKVMSLTAEGRLQAAVLLAMPFLILSAMFFLRREYALLLLGHPWMLVGTLAAQVVGGLWIRSILNFEEN